MDNTIVFQNHTFYLKEAGIYETKDDFVLDNENWTWGEFPDAYLVCRLIENKSHPWLISYESSSFDRMSYIASVENTNCRLYMHKDLRVSDLSL